MSKTNDKNTGEPRSLDGLVIWKRYFVRVWICAKWEFRRIPIRTKRDWFDFVDSALDCLKETISMWVSIFRIVFHVPLSIWRCIFVPIKHGSKVEEKLTENVMDEAERKQTLTG